MAAMTSLLTSWRHCFAVDSEACGPRGLWRSWRATTSVPSGSAPSGGMTTIAAKHCRCVAAVVTPVAVLAPWAFVWRDHPTLELEVASYSVPC
jgi:hypothetical protein